MLIDFPFHVIIEISVFVDVYCIYLYNCISFTIPVLFF